MPTPGQMTPADHASHSLRARLASAQQMTTSPSTGLEAEISALRHEIAELRRELAPVPSMILTGREVLEQFKALQRLSAVA